jgi:hypothetical protein
MKNELKENSFKIKFDGQQHQVDANVLINSLIHTTKIIQETNKYLNSGKQIDIKVKALEKGSFLVNLELVPTIVDSLKNLLTRENLSIAVEIITLFVGFLELKKFIKGEKSAKTIINEHHVTIIKGDNNSITISRNTYNIYISSSVINDSISQNFETIDNEPAITAFEITNSVEEPLIRIEKSDFKLMAQENGVATQPTNVLNVKATLNIVRLSFEPGLKWDFYYLGNKIPAKITDPDFQEQINKGKQFAKGDILEVDLQINQIFDDSVNTYINKSYQINKIVNHKSRAEQIKIDFTSD